MAKENGIKVWHKSKVKHRIGLFFGIVFFSTFSILLMFSFSLLNSENLLYHQDKKSNENEIDFLPRIKNLYKIIPPYHVFSLGDTLTDIASQYEVSWSEIIRFNKITDMRMVRPGDRILLPSGIKQLHKASFPWEMYQKPSKLPHIITIRSFPTKGNLPFSVDFSTLFDFPDSLSPVWDFGTTCFSFTKQAHYTYLKAGEYSVTLSLADEKGKEVFSNSIMISVDRVNMDSDKDIFFTMEHVGEVLNLAGRFYDESGNPQVFNSRFDLIQDPPLLSQYTDKNRFMAISPGYTKVTLASETNSYSFYLFVSPFPTQHSIEPEFNWYKTQFNTGMYGNCGPACVAMVVHWAKGKRISVVESRGEIGLPIKSGAVSFEHMVRNFRFHKIKTYFTIINTFNDMKDLIDRGNIAIILFNTTYIQPVQGDESIVFVDRYYPDTTGHYVVIKGYSLDKKYFVVYDPIPGDWQANTIRYTDGESMIGRNRYFLVDQVFQSIKGKRVLEIERNR